MLRMDITNIPIAGDAFDAILVVHVLEHIMDDRKAMRELFRILKPGGWAILQVPILRERTYEDASIVTPKDREKNFGQNDHVRIYGRDFKDRLEAAGFKVNESDFVNALGTTGIEKYSLDAREKIFFCTKSKW